MNPVASDEKWIINWTAIQNTRHVEYPASAISDQNNIADVCIWANARGSGQGAA